MDYLLSDPPKQVELQPNREQPDEGRRQGKEGSHRKVVVRYAAILTRKGQFRARETKTCATKPCFSSKVAKCHSFWLLGGTGVI